MTLAEILDSVFPVAHRVAMSDGLISGFGTLATPGMPVREVVVIGIANGVPLGTEGALALASRVLEALRSGNRSPILVLVDSDSQRMSRRDELLGLNEYLAHLAKSLILANRLGHPTVGLLYGHSAAGAFIATALATGGLVALPDAVPEVMDLTSMSRVTKLPLETLQRMALDTPVFAPGLANMVAMGAISAIWNPDRPLDDQLSSLLERIAAENAGARDRGSSMIGQRFKAAEIAARVRQEALNAD